MLIFSPLYSLSFFLAFLLALLLVPMVKKIAVRFDIVDKAGREDRKIHLSDKPLLGGAAIFASFFAVIFLFRVFGFGDFSRIPDNFLIGIFIGALFIMIGGALDDKFNLRPYQQIVWPLLAAASVLFFGLKITYITNPLGGPTSAIIYLAPAIGGIISFIWLMVMMYTTKFLDGLDGLATGVAAIAAVIIFLLSLDWDVPLSGTGIMALALVGAALGFLVFNWRPAQIFLGEGGSIFLGFMLGALSIISGSKIATTFLVVGVPALDVAWVFIQRLARGESPFSHADRKHLHYRLLDLGFSQKGAVLFLYFVALSFGSLAIFAKSFGKLIGLIILIIFMAVIALMVYFNSKKYPQNS